MNTDSKDDTFVERWKHPRETIYHADTSKKFICPICFGDMETDDIFDANWVALGEVVCSFLCYEQTYSLEGEYAVVENGLVPRQRTLPFFLPP